MSHATRNATKATGATMRNTVWIDSAYAAARPWWTAGGSLSRIAGGDARARESGRQPCRSKVFDQVTDQHVREDGSTDRGAEGSTDGSEERRPRGRDAELGVGDRVLDDEHQYLHDAADAHAEHEHVEHAGQPDPSRFHP